MPRLFIALEIPAEVATGLTLHRGGVSGARWIEPADYHITLRFLGDVDRRMANDIDHVLSDLTAYPFEVTLDALGSFGGGFHCCTLDIRRRGGLESYFD